MNEYPTDYESLRPGLFFGIIDDPNYKEGKLQELYYLKISDRLYFSFVDKKLRSANEIVSKPLIVMDYEVY